MAQRAYTDEEIDAAVAALSEPGRMRDAEALVTRSAPQLGAVLLSALEDGGWFSDTHDTEVLKAAAVADINERLAAVKAMLAEETRVGMLVGVAAGFELARDLNSRTQGSD